MRRANIDLGDAYAASLRIELAVGEIGAEHSQIELCSGRKNPPS